MNSRVNMLKRMKLNEKFDINVIITTHSPFVLSDIPGENILCLKRGKPHKGKDVLSRTFCANVYDLLVNRFFMNDFVGEFAHEKLDEIIRMVKTKKRLSAEQYYERLNYINLIGDEFVREKLNEELYDRLDVDNKRSAIENEINQHDARIQFLRKQLEKSEKRIPRK